MNQYPKVKCLNCRKEIGECNFKTFTVNLKGYDKNGKRKLFCSQECYDQYKKQFEVEVYNGCSIYAVEHLGEIRYMLGGSLITILRILRIVERELI